MTRRKPSVPVGFAALDPEDRKRVASSGGNRCHQLGRAHEWSSAEAAAAGRKGGKSVSQDREHMAEIGRKGGLATSSDTDHMARIGGVGGSSMSDGPRGRKHMAEIGRRGGLAVSQGKAGRAHMSEIAKKGAVARKIVADADAE